MTNEVIATTLLPNWTLRTVLLSLAQDKPPTKLRNNQSVQSRLSDLLFNLGRVRQFKARMRVRVCTHTRTHMHLRTRTGRTCRADIRAARFRAVAVGLGRGDALRSGDDGRQPGGQLI